MKQVTLSFILFMVVSGLVACAPGTADRPEEALPEATEPIADAPTATVTVTATAEATAAETAAPVVEDVTATQPPAATEAPPTDPPPTPTAEVATAGDDAGEGAVNGRTPEGAYFLGRADAPVTIIDYSDFM